MNNDSKKSINLNEMHDLIDLYKYASIEGEKVEFIVFPTKDNKRVVEIGIQNGFPRDRDTFIFEDGDEFDNSVYPELLSYFTRDDSLNNWEITTSSNDDKLIQGSNETQSGNLVYLDTYNEKLFDNVKDHLNTIEEKVTYKNNNLTNNDMIWDEIILYAKSRRVTQDFYVGVGLDDKEISGVFKLISKLADDVKEINYGNSKKAHLNNEKFIADLLKDKNRLRRYFPLYDDTIYELDTPINIKKLATLVGAEKRLRKRLDLSNESIKNKMFFAVTQLEKVGFFDLKNGTVKQFENKEFIESKPKAINDLLKILDNDGLYYEEMREQYKECCYELLEYLERKANNGKKVIETKLDNSSIVFEEYNDIFKPELANTQHDNEEIDKTIDDIKVEKANIDVNTGDMSKLANLAKQISDYLLEQEKENKIDKTKYSSIANDINLATYELIVDKYKDKLDDLINKNELPAKEMEIVNQVVEKKYILLNYYNEYYGKTEKLNKEDLSSLAEAEVYLKAIFKLESRYSNNIDEINNLKKQENLKPSGDLLLSTLENEQDKNDAFMDELIEFNINKYKEISEKYKNNDSIESIDAKKDKEDLLKIMTYKIKLVDAYNALMFKESELSKEEYMKLANYETRLAKINEIDAKYVDNISVIIDELKTNNQFVLPSSKLWLSALINEKEKNIDNNKKELIELKNSLFEIVKQEDEQKEDEEIIEIKDSFDEAMSYSNKENPATIKVVFDKENKNEADVIISNKMGVQDIVIYQRTIPLDKLNNKIMKVLRELYSKDNEIDYNIKFNVSSSRDVCLLMIGNERRTFNIVNAPEEFVSKNKKELENLMKKKDTGKVK